MKHILITTLIATCLVSGAAFADNDCTDSGAQWQTQEQLRQMVTNSGWQVNRITVDDGCYEVEGLDRKGHQVEAKFSPASLKLIELDIKFYGAGDTSDYLDPSRKNLN